jgi:tape measure domain-containing protein
MSTTIGKVAYVATWDASQLVKGVMTSRQTFSAQKKIVEAMMTPMDRYTTGMENLKKIVEKYPDVARHQLQLEKDITRQYLSEESAVRKLTSTEQKRLNLLNMSAAGKNAGRSGAASQAEMNRARGLADQERIRRFTVAVDREAEIGRKGLQERLRLYKAERAAEQKRTRDQQMQFDQQLSAARRAMKQRDQMRREDLARTMKYHSNEKAWMTAGGSSGSAAKGALRGSAGGGISSVVGGAAKGLVGGAAVGALALSAKTAYDVAKEGIPLNQDIERTTASMNVFTGSLAKSAIMMEKMRSLSAETGVSFTGYTRGARTMMQFGVAADDVMPKLREMAIITGGDSDRMQSLALAFAQTTAAGKLMGQEVLQMVNAGWSPFEEIGKRLGKTVPELRKEMEAGNITAKMVSDALTAATEAGGRFNGMLEQLEGTSARASDKEKSAWESATAASGQMLEPLTGVYYMLSTKIAGEVESFAKGMSLNKDIVEELSAAEQKAEARREAASKRQERVDQVRSKRIAAEKRMQQEAAAEKQLGLDGAKELQLNATKDMISPEKSKKFDQIYSLLNKDNQSMMAGDFINSKGDVEAMKIYLSDSVKAELEKLDAMEKQVEVVKKRLAFEEKGKAMADSITEEMANSNPLEKLTRQLTELAVMNNQGLISNDQMDFAVNKAAGESAKSGGQKLAVDSMRSGSQDAYRFLVGIQDRNLKLQMDQSRQQINVQTVMADVLKRSEAHLAEIADTKIGSDG